ncbi:hypothetical protein [Blastococcus sp. LR1]|uniref:hypothetical protein n=1 Tax=Blastococcus sp. LR1 TaxID=2877000 RepID=UPI001CCF4A7E|nr:hypothetical protein [Blastococcus sp. LR1]MCA0146667.1 hypothetical protein [Blastococcus sp. LR1]
MLEAWLRHEHLPPAERAERLAGDVHLVQHLRQQGFQGEDWDFFVNELARYGLAVVSGWMRSGLMASKCAEKRIVAPALPDAVRQDPEAIDEIATETVAEAIVHFRDEVLVPGVWDPAKGAALKTFFIGQCMKRYANVARRWLNHDLRPSTEVVTHERDVLDRGRVTGVEDDVLRSLTAQRILEGVDNPRAARALVMDALGYSNAEIAIDLGTTPDGASSLIKRARAAIRRQHSTPEGGTA